MARKDETFVNETTDLSLINNDGLMELFGEKAGSPAILMFDQKKVLPLNEIINLASGENVSLSEVLNTEVELVGMGAVKLDYIDETTGEFSQYIRYILITDKGNFTTTSTFIGRTLKMLYQTMTRPPKVMFKQKEKDGRRRFIMEIL